MTKLEQLKAAGEAPEFMNIQSYNTISNGYLLENETPKQMYRRAARSAAKNYGSESSIYEEDFFNAMWNNWLCCSTPVLANAEGENLQISCYSGITSNKVAGIMDHMKELAILTKRSGGVGSSFDLLRPDSNDIIPFAKMLEATIEGITQGKSRRGSVASYLNITHPNAEEFIEIRKPTGDLSRKCLSVAFHNAIVIDDDVMNKIIGGDSHYRKLWNKIMTTRVETGEPYILYQGNANKNCPEEYVGKITQSNLCLHPSTKVKTREFGDIEIEKLVGQGVHIFDGKEWVYNDKFRKTQDNATFVTLELGYTKKIVCTDNHKWPLHNGDLVPFSDLKLGDLIKTGHDGVAVKVTGLGLSMLQGPAYCTTVPSTSCFLLADNILSGNCSEIAAPVTPEETFVCCLSSLNLSRFREWQNYVFENTKLTLVELSIYFLDSIITNFINQTKGMVGLENARRFAERHRMLGLGVLGWHTFLQSEMVPFESFKAMQLNNQIFSQIRKEADFASISLGNKYGHCEVSPTRRNTALLAIAPTMSNSLISGGVSQGVEPLTANLFVQKSAKGTFIKKNPVLVKLLIEKNLDTTEVWEQINADRGSVKNVIGLSDDEKRVFLTAREINQHSIVQQAAQRQVYIDQAQSINLFFNIPSNEIEAKAIAKYMNNVHIEAWQLGVKSLYYLKTDSPLKGDVIAVEKDGTCLSCQG